MVHCIGGGVARTMSDGKPSSIKCVYWVSFTMYHRVQNQDRLFTATYIREISYHVA